MGMSSCLYEGVVRHYRYQPVAHRFRYSLFLLFIDLDELPTLFAGKWFWSTTRPAVASFRRNEHLGSPDQPLGDSVRELVKDRLGFYPTGPVRLLTHLRYFGFSMNPVSFYYCYDDQGRSIEAVVAEVNNTPWNQQHCYVFDTRGELTEAMRQNWLDKRQAKQFHVSPFLDMNMEYAWYLSVPGDLLEVTIENWTSHGKIFDAHLTLRRQQMSSWNLARALIQYPLMTLQVFAAIYWQALRLWMKRIPYVPHPGSIPVRTGKGIRD